MKQNLTRIAILVKAVGLLLFVPSILLAVRHERLIDTWQPTHYDISLKFNDQLTEITNARTEITIKSIKPLSLIDMDFGDMTTDSVSLNNKPALFVHKDGKLLINLSNTISPNTEIKVTVVYHGRPKDGLILTNDKDGSPSAVGDNWPDRVHHWIPSLDHPSAKATVSFTVSAPNRDLVVANGRLVSVQSDSLASKTWTYSESSPIPPYCMIIGVGDFSLIKAEQPTIEPLSFYIPKSDSEYATKGFGSADEAMQMFSEIVAPYPYEKLALIIGATRFGGMENSSAIVFPGTLFRPRPQDDNSKTFGIRMGLVDVVAHEIAHQWFGDSVTESTWSDLWLSEGFATYFAGLFIEKYDGEEMFQNYLREAANTAFSYEKKTRTPIHDRDTENLFALLNPNNYQKGAWVLHMLRMRLGDEAFFRGIRAYYTQHKSATASTEDLRTALEQASGTKLQPFFTRWVYDSGHPAYEVMWSWTSGQDLKIVVNQRQEGGPFLDPIPVTVVTAKGESNFVIQPESKTTAQSFHIDQQPQTIRIDPNNTLLKEVRLVQKTNSTTN